MAGTPDLVALGVLQVEVPDLAVVAATNEGEGIDVILDGVVDLGGRLDRPLLGVGALVHVLVLLRGARSPCVSKVRPMAASFCRARHARCVPARTQRRPGLRRREGGAVPSGEG